MSYKFETLAVHAGVEPDPVTGSRNFPIHQTVSYAFRDAQHAANLFALNEVGYIYSRLTNPTVNALQTKIAALHGGAGATAFASGHAAENALFFALMEPGAELIATNQLYGGSLNLIGRSFKKFGWNTIFKDTNDLEGIKKAINDKTRGILIESLANPGGTVTDIGKFAEIAKAAKIPLIVDNTLASPYLCRPFEFGADIVVESTTKFISGNNTAIGGVVVDSGNYPFKDNPRFPSLSKPLPDYNGTVFAEKFGNLGLTIYLHAIGLRDLGGCMSPFNAWLTLNQLDTLALRMEKHASNSLAVAKFLKSHPKVAWVKYAGLEDDPGNSLAKKYLKGKGGSVFTFGVKGGYESGVKVVNSVKLLSHLANLGDTRSLIIHPSSTTHSQLTAEEKVKAGAGDDVIRLAIGIEDQTDIIADLDQALKNA